MAALIVVVWGVMGVVSVVQYAARNSAERLTGFVRSVDGTDLVLAVSRSPVLRAFGIASKDYVFELAGATIKIDGREGAPSALRSGDAVGVLFTESHGKLIARVVTATRGAAEK